MEDIRKAIHKSDLIALSEDKEKICRKQPVKVKQNIDDCTIYVENIKADANHEWLTQVFSEFGTVVYVSIPKYKQNKENKGFAFVEFDTEEEARTALSYFEGIGCKMPSETNPKDLRSIVTYEEKTTLTKEDENNVDSINEKIDSQNPKKRKLSDDDTNTEKKQKTDLNLDKPMESESEKGVVEAEENNETENKKKKKNKKDKKRNYIKDLGLQVLSKLVINIIVI